MALLTVLDDFPINFGHRYCRRRQVPSLLRLLDRDEDPMERNLRGLPSFCMELEDIIEPKDKRKKMRKVKNAEQDSSEKELVMTKDNRFQVHLNTRSFEPEDITVKVIGDELGVTAKHETKVNNGYEYHGMYRSFQLPDGVDPDTVTSRLTTSGQLTIEAPLKGNENAIEKTLHGVREKDAEDDQERASGSKTDS